MLRFLKLFWLNNWPLLMFTVVVGTAFFLVSKPTDKSLSKKTTTTEPQKPTEKENLAVFAKNEPIATILNVEDKGVEFGKMLVFVTAEANGKRIFYQFGAEPRNIRFETDESPIFAKGDRAKVKIVDGRLVLERIKDVATPSP
ncbi:MAG: hypothetical protein Q7S57_03385 [bacterium]|nr:hypothetical protein [bacterium]